MVTWQKEQVFVLFSHLIHYHPGDINLLYYRSTEQEAAVDRNIPVGSLVLAQTLQFTVVFLHFEPCFSPSEVRM